VLSYLYVTPVAGSPYYKNPSLLDWVATALGYWSTLQHRDGSFDEAYPFERSLAATAFTCFYVGESLELVGTQLPASVRDATRQTLARAGTWLTQNDETHGFLSNHLAAAAGALCHIHRQTGEPGPLKRSQHFLDLILARQSPEGWYDEYGGADPGYQTHGSFYLARCWQLMADERLLASLARGAKFIAHFVHPDGSIGGEYTSRNTQTFYPAAFEMLAPHDPASAWIASAVRMGFARHTAASLSGIDIYNYFPFLNNFVFAHRAAAARNDEVDTAADPTPPDGLAWFPLAGLARQRTARYDAFIGTAKGGVLKVFDRHNQQLVYSDCGYVGRLSSGAMVSSQYQDAQRPTRVDGSTIHITGDLVEFSRPTMTPWIFLAFRIFTLTVGRLPRLAKWLKAELVKTLVYRRRAIRVRMSRRIDFAEQSIRVTDHLDGEDATRIETLRWDPRFTTIHMGSSRYFVMSELAAVPAARMIDPSEVARGFDTERVVSF
jgi:hypothetical protein